MKVPKRLPRDLESLVELEEAFGSPTLLSAQMRRHKGRLYIEMTYIDSIDNVLITLDSHIYYNKYERRIEEDASAHRRHFDVFRKAVLAS